MTVAEAARELAVDVRTIRRRIQRGEMAAERVGPRLYLIARAEVERWKGIGRLKPGPKKIKLTPEESKRARAVLRDAARAHAAALKTIREVMDDTRRPPPSSSEEGENA